MLKRSAIAGVLAAFGLVALATNAEAARLGKLWEKGLAPTGATNIVSDDSVEFLIQNDGNNTLDVGDAIRGIVNMNSLQNLKVGLVDLGADGNSEFSGLFQTLVIGKKFVGTDINGNSLYNFSFGPDPAFAEANSLGLTGAMVLMYEDISPDFTVNQGIAGDIANATNGFYYWALGMNGTFGLGPDGIAASGDEHTDLDEAWIATNTLDTVPTVPQVNIGTANLALNRIFGAGGLGDSLALALQASAFGSNGGVEFTGSAEFQTTISGSNWPIADEAEITFQVIVPLPAAAWAGIAMLGLIGAGRKLRRRSA